MKKSTIKLIAMLLCLAMIGSYLPMAAHAEEEATVYTLYPTPHSVEYGEGSFELADLNVLYDSGQHPSVEMQFGMLFLTAQKRCPAPQEAYMFQCTQS